MSKVILWKQPDGTVRIIHPAPADRFPDEPEDVWLRRVIHYAVRSESDIQAAKQACEIIDLTELPNNPSLSDNRRFRNAWRHNGDKTITVDVNAAKEIRRMELIHEVEKQIELLSKDLTRAEDEEDLVAVTEIRAARKALRNIERIELPTDLVSLDKYEPLEILSAKSVVAKRKVRSLDLTKKI